MRSQIAAARNVGIDTVMVAPMITGLSNFHRLVREHPGIAFVAHPSLAGSRIAPPLLFGKIFRMLGADAIVFPNHGGRFGYSAETCQALARAALADWHGLRASVPVPAQRGCDGLGASRKRRIGLVGEAVVIVHIVDAPARESDRKRSQRMRRQALRLER